jgi:hypothetical protein
MCTCDYVSYQVELLVISSSLLCLLFILHLHLHLLIHIHLTLMMLILLLLNVELFEVYGMRCVDSK